MSIATIRAQLKTTLDTVANIGQTYAYDRYNNDWSAFLSLFKTTISGTPQIRGWAIGYEGHDAVRLGTTAVIRSHTFVTRGFLGLDDSANTEATMAALAETVVNAYDDDTTFHGLTGLALPGVDPSFMRVFELRQFHTVFCHYVEISTLVREERAI